MNLKQILTVGLLALPVMFLLQSLIPDRSIWQNIGIAFLAVQLSQAAIN